MKAMIVRLTDEEVERIESTARDRGVTVSDLLHDAVSAYLRAVPQTEPERSEILESNGPPNPWIIGLFSGDESYFYAPEEDPAEREQISRLIWEDSFGGTRPWPEPKSPSATSTMPNEDPEPAS